MPENATSTPLLRILALYEMLWRLRKSFVLQEKTANQNKQFPMIRVHSCLLAVTFSGVSAKVGRPSMKAAVFQPLTLP